MKISLSAIFIILIDKGIQFHVMPCAGYAVPCLRMWDQDNASADYMYYDIRGMCIMKDHVGALLVSEKWADLFKQAILACKQQSAV